MNIIPLPEMLIGPRATEHGGIVFYHHRGHKRNFRSKLAFQTHCISLVLEGKKHVIAGANTLHYTTSDLLLFKSGNYLSTEIAADGEPYSSLLIFFGADILRSLRYKYQNKYKRNGNVPLPPLSFRSDEYIEGFKATTLSALSGPNPLSQDLQRLKFEELMVHLLETHGRVVLDYFEESLGSSDMDRLQQVVESNKYRNISTEEMAFLCHMSTSTFKRKFQKIYHTSPGKWLSEVRLDRSAYLLSVRHMSPSEIYRQAGFSTLSSYIYAFKQKFGITPKQYQMGR